jgi:hypothetical protein
VERTLNTWKRKCSGMGYNVDNTTLYTLQFADDQVVVVQSKKDLDYMWQKLQEEYLKWDLNLLTMEFGI